eukprot:jgi/Bigna1/142780/aug1.73_g17488
MSTSVASLPSTGGMRQRRPAGKSMSPVMSGIECVRQRSSVSLYGGIATGLALCVIAYLIVYGDPPEFKIVLPMETTVRVATWNIAAINNNPFEFWITNKDPHYDILMSSVQRFINDPGAMDVEVAEVFTPKMLNELRFEMQKMGWQGVDEAITTFHKEFKPRKIVSDFLKDPTLGAKRLISMPDRITNTLNLPNGQKLHRPTVINCYAGYFDSVESWWRQWKKFMFETNVNVGSEERKVAQLLTKINHFKYPALSQDESRISLPLQTIAIAIFDSILVHMVVAVNVGEITARLWKKGGALQDMQRVSPGKWHELRTTMCRSLNKNKDPKRDQNSLIFLRRRSFKFHSMREITEIVKEELSKNGEKVPVSDGDIFAIRALDNFGRKYILASFHGDTNGLATIPVVSAVDKLNKASKKSEFVEKGDRNPKDFILFYKGDFQEFGTTKDNTGNKKYIEDMVFPTLAFPSDHAVLSTTLAILKDDDRQDDGDDDDE